jgi:hypothetical protein
MSNVAALGFSIDSSDARSASTDLDKLAASAAKTETAANSLNTADKALAGSLAALLTEVKNVNAGLATIAGTNASVAASTAATVAAMDKLAVATRAPKQETDGLASSLDSLRAKYNPLIAVSQQYQAALKSINAQEAAGAIGAREANLYRAQAAMVAEKAAQANDNHSVALGRTTAAAKLTSNQMLNLSRQGNDAITMFAMGADGMMIFASQAGQVYGALEEGPGGLSGSLKAIGSSILGFITPLRIAAVGLTAAAAAAIYFGDRSAENTKKAEDAAKSYGSTISRLKLIQGDLSGAAGRVFGREMMQSESEVRAQLQIASIQQSGARRASIANIGGNEGIALQTGTLGALDRVGEMLTSTGAVRKQFQDLYGELVRGERTVESFQAAVVGIRMNPETSDEMKAVADSLLDASQNAREAEARVKALQGAIREAKREAAQKRFDAASDDFSGFVPDRQTIRQQIEQAYRTRSGAISELQQSPRVVEGLQAGADADRKKALDEVARKESVVREGRDLDLRSIGARTVAEKALIAAERERLALSGENIEESERASRIAAASATILAQANRDATDALRASTTANAAAGLEGYQAAVTGIINSYREQIDAANGSTEAIEKLTAARNLDIQTLQMQTQKSLFDPQRSQLASLRAEASALGQSDDFRRRVIATMQAEEDIRRAGINSTGEQADAYRKNALALSEYEDGVRRVGDAWGEVNQTTNSAVDSLVDGLAGGKFDFKSILKDFQKTILDLSVGNPLKNLLTGSSLGTMSDLFKGAGKAPELKMAGVQSVANMQVSAAMVTIGGAGLAGLTGAPGAIETLLNPANNNTAGSAAKYRNAIAAIESAGSGDYAARGPVTSNGDRAYGRYQMMGANIGPWSKQALGQSIDVSTFMANPAMQDKIFDKIFGGYVAKFGEAGASQAWFGGPGSVGKSGRKDMLGTSVGGYSNRFMSELGSADPLAQASTTLAASATDFTQDFGMTAGAVTAGMGQVVDQFLPGFGGIFTKLLDGLSQVGGGGGGLLSTIFGGGGGGGDPWAGMRSVGTNANGTDNWRGGLSWVGEKGPELMNVPRGAQIIPNHLLARNAQSGGGMPSITMSGATLNINGNADSVTITQAKQMLEAQSAKDRRDLQREIGPVSNQYRSLKG